MATTRVIRFALFATLMASFLAPARGSAQALAAADPGKTCLGQLQQSAHARQLADKVPVDLARAAAADTLPASAKPSASDKAALSRLIADWDHCENLSQQWRHDHTEEPVDAVLRGRWTDLKFILTDLRDGKMTFATALRARRDTEADAARRMDLAVQEVHRAFVENQQLRKEIQASQRYEAAQSRAQDAADVSRQQRLQRQLESQRQQFDTLRQGGQRTGPPSPRVPPMGCNTPRFGALAGMGCN